MNILSFFTEMVGIDFNKDFPNILTSSSGNERLKVGIVLKSASQKWKRQRATFTGSTAKMASSFDFKASIHIDFLSEIYLRVNVSSTLLLQGQQNGVPNPCKLFDGQHFFANISNEIPHYPTR